MCSVGSLRLKGVLYHHIVIFIGEGSIIDDDGGIVVDIQVISAVRHTTSIDAQQSFNTTTIGQQLNEAAHKAGVTKVLHTYGQFTIT